MAFYAANVFDGDPQIAPVRYSPDGTIVYEDTADIENRYRFLAGNAVAGRLEDAPDISDEGGPAVPYYTYVPSGEGDALWQHVSLADVRLIDVDITSCTPWGCGGSSSQVGQEFYVFGERSDSLPTPSYVTYKGVWNGQLVYLNKSSQDLFLYCCDGTTEIRLAPSSGSMIGTLKPDLSIDLYDTNLSDIQLIGQLTGTSFSGTASASLALLSADDRLSGTFEGNLFGPNGAEIGGVVVLNEDHAHTAGVDASPETDVALVGSFIGK
ncbi:transferrin-binding protein-like solute binding protein [Boseongicola aestuarii]|nr:transferrin-binding protein-like solute binding protein [Boseongicola aestuarii]